METRPREARHQESGEFGEKKASRVFNTRSILLMARFTGCYAAEVDRQLTGSAPVQSTSAKPLEAPPGLKEQASEVSAPSRGLFRSIRNAVGKSK